MGGRSSAGTAARAGIGVVAAAFLLVATAAPALAHNSLTGSSPQDGARVARPPVAVSLSFLSRLDPATTRLTVTDPTGKSAAAGKPRYTGSKVTVPFRAGPAGRYTIAYEVPSGDGHPVKGEVDFTMTTGAAPAASAAPSAPAVSGVPRAPSVPDARANPQPAQAARSTAQGGSWWVWALIAAVIGALTVGGIALRRRARPGP